MLRKEESDEFEKDIESARVEIAALQKRIGEMVARRKKAQELSDARAAHQTGGLKNNPRILKIDLEIANGRERMKMHPQQSKSIQIQIDALEMERYRLLCRIEEGWP
jgi:hypothetical protein